MDISYSSSVRRTRYRVVSSDIHYPARMITSNSRTIDSNSSCMRCLRTESRVPNYYSSAAVANVDLMPYCSESRDFRSAVCRRCSEFANRALDNYSRAAVVFAGLIKAYCSESEAFTIRVRREDKPNRAPNYSSAALVVVGLMSLLLGVRGLYYHSSS